MDRDLRRFLLSLSISSFMLGLAMSSGLYFISIKAELLGASDTEIGFLGFLRAIPYIFLPAMVGFLLRGVRKVLLYAISPILSSIFYALMYLLDNVSHIILTQVIMGIAFVFYWPIAEMMVASSTTPENRVKVFSYYSTSWTSGFLIGPSIGGFIADRFGFDYSFLFSSITSILVLPLIFLIKEPRSIEEGIERVEGTGSIKAKLLPYLYMLTLQSMVYGTLVVIFPNYAWRLGINEFYIGTIFTVLSLARLLSFFLVGSFARLQHRFSFTISSIFSAIPFILIAYIPSIVTFYIAVAIYAANLSYFTSMIFGRLTIMMDPKRYGFVVGIYEGIFGVGFAVGPLFAGFLSDLIGLRESFLVQFMLASGIAIIAHTFKIERRNVGNH